MNPLEQEYLDNVERAKARDRKRELFISWLVSGFIPMSELAIEQSLDGRLRKTIRVVLFAIVLLANIAIVVWHLGTERAQRNAGIALFVFAAMGVILGGKLVYARFRRWNNARLERKWARVLGLNGDK